MDFDIAPSDRLIHDTIVDDGFEPGLVLGPDLDPEHVWLVVAGPDLELVLADAADGADAFEFGVVSQSPPTTRSWMSGGSDRLP